MKCTNVFVLVSMLFFITILLLFFYFLFFFFICLLVFFVEGKAAKLVSNAHFNKEASKQYGSLTDLDREKLVGQVSSEVEMTVTQRTRRAKKLFINMQNQVIKYRG